MRRRLPPRMDMYKTKLCPFIKSGLTCNRPFCTFAHSKEDLQKPPDLYHTKLCPSIFYQKPCKNKNCGYAHSYEELENSKIDQLFYKTQICHFWPESCKNGDQCRFAHGDVELNNSDSSTCSIEDNINKSECTSTIGEDSISIDDTKSSSCFYSKKSLVPTEISEIETVSSLSIKIEESKNKKTIYEDEKLNTVTIDDQEETDFFNINSLNLNNDDDSYYDKKDHYENVKSDLCRNSSVENFYQNYLPENYYYPSFNINTHHFENFQPTTIIYLLNNGNISTDIIYEE